MPTTPMRADQYLAWEGTTDVLVNPSVVVAVLSKRTETHDRGLKWDGFGGGWQYSAVESGGHVILSSGISLDVETTYAGVFELDGEA